MSSQGSQLPFHWHDAQLDDRNFQIRGRTLFFVVVLFAIILLITILFLYARWVCRFHRRTSVEASVSQAARPPPHLQRAQRLDDAAIKGLPITLYQRSSSSSDLNGSGDTTYSECCICLSVFEDGEKVKILPQCEHCYHSECVNEWLRTQSSCPICRISLRVDSGVGAALRQIVVE